MIYASSQRIALYEISSNYSLSYKDLHCKIEFIKKKLREHGCSPGHKVCVNVSKNLDFIPLFYALNSLHCIVIPLNDDLITKHIDYIYESLEPNYLIENNENDYKVKALTCKQDSCNLPENVSLISYTSGTTAEPKGVLITNENLKSIIQAMNEFIQLENMKIMGILCMGHMYGLSIFISALNRGATLYLDDSTNIDDISNLLDKETLDGIFINAKNREYFLDNKILMHRQFKNRSLPELIS